MINKLLKRGDISDRLNVPKCSNKQERSSMGKLFFEFPLILPESVEDYYLLNKESYENRNRRSIY
tara:strand:- start:169 stop:363 length:195 start_codon:yes stop_codon:yes gene_type:complete